MQNSKLEINEPPPRSYARGHSSTMTADEMANKLVAAARSGDGLVNAKEYSITQLRRWEQEIRQDEVGRLAYSIQNSKLKMQNQSPPPSFPRRPWVLSKQYGMTYVLSQDNEIILGSDACAKLGDATLNYIIEAVTVA